MSKQSSKRREDINEVCARAVDCFALLAMTVLSTNCPLLRVLSPRWIEYRVGANTLTLAIPSLTAADAPTPKDSASLQLAFKVSSADVDRCAAELTEKGVPILLPPTDQAFGHRTLFFRDPDGNLLEMFAEI